MSRVMKKELMRKLNSPMRFTPVCACCDIGLDGVNNHFYKLELSECQFIKSRDPFPEVSILRNDVGVLYKQSTYICDCCANKIIESVDFNKKEDDE